MRPGGLWWVKAWVHVVVLAAFVVGVWAMVRYAVAPVAITALTLVFGASAIVRGLKGGE